MRKWRADDFWFELVEGPSPDGIGFVRYHQVTCRKCKTQSKTRQMGQSNDHLRKFFIRQGWDVGRARNLHLCPECAHKHKDLRTKPQPQPNVVPLHPTPPQPKRVTLKQTWEQASEAERAEFWGFLRAVYGHKLITEFGALIDKEWAWRQENAEPEPPAPLLFQVIAPGLTHFDYNEIITATELLLAQQKYGSDAFSVKACEPPDPEPPKKTVDEFLHRVKEHGKPKPMSEWQHGPHIDSMPVEAKLPPSEHPVAMPGVETTPPPPPDDDDEPADWWQEIHGEKK
jgi:hypothetical protein